MDARLLAPAVFLLVACRGPSLEVEATVNETTVTVIELSWSTSAEGSSWVEYGTTEDYGMVTPVFDAATDHHIPLYGLPPLSDVYYRAVTEIDGQELSATGQTATLGLPSTLPDLEVTTHEPDLLSSEPYMLALLVGTSSAIMVVNRDGDVVWYRELEASVGESAPVFGDVQFALDGNDFVYNRFTAEFDDPDQLNSIIRVSLTGELIEERYTPQHHHAFAQMGDGRYAFVAADKREAEVDGETMDVVGDAIVISEPDGSTSEVFNTWDDWDQPVSVSEWAVHFYGDIPDWTHGNGLFYYPDDDTYLLSAGYSQVVIEVDGGTGEVLRDFGRDADVEVADGSPQFYFQHDAHWTGTDTMMMTTRYVPDQSSPQDTMIIGIEYEIVDGELHEIWSYGKDAAIESIAEGQARRMANGNAMVNWGFSGVCHEATPEGQLVWELTSSFGTAMVRTRPIASFYEGY